MTMKTGGPERIWVLWADKGEMRPRVFDTDDDDIEQDLRDDVPYIRADIADALVAAAYEDAARRLKDAANDEADMGSIFNAAIFDTASNLVSKRTPADARAALAKARGEE